MSLRKEAVSKLEEEGRAWSEARLALENQVRSIENQVKASEVDSDKNFAFPLFSMFGFLSYSLTFTLQVRSSQASAKLAEESAASRDEMHKQEVFAIFPQSIFDQSLYTSVSHNNGGS